MNAATLSMNGDGSSPSWSLATLATTEATHAPIRNLPSIAMLSRPDRSDRMPANAPSVIGVASASVPWRTPVRLAVLPSSSAARVATTHSGMITASIRRHRNDAPR